MEQAFSSHGVKFRQSIDSVIESLEVRRLMCIDHLGREEPPLQVGQPMASTAALLRGGNLTASTGAAGSSNHFGAVIGPVIGAVPGRAIPITVNQAAWDGKTVTGGKTVRTKPLGGTVEPLNPVGPSTAAAPITAEQYEDQTTPTGTTSVAGTFYPTNTYGLPLLNSRPDAGALNIFLDFDGYTYGTAGTTGYINDAPFDLNSVPGSFDGNEQFNIVETWRDIASYFSTLNVNITTVQPQTGGSNTAFIWHRISNSISGGAAYVGWFTNERSNSWTGQDGGTSRHSGVAHEIGHQLNLSHQSEYNLLGEKTSEYTDGFGTRDRSVIGIDYAQNVRRWFYGRDSDGVTSMADDLKVMAARVAQQTGGDGYRPDDYSSAVASATTIPAAGYLAGSIEKIDDVDLFKFTVSTTGTYQIDATPTFESAFSGKVELLDSTGTNVIAARDDADRRNTNNNDQEFSVSLAPGTYYVRVQSSGDYGEQGEYVVTAAPLLNGFASRDINDPYRAGTAAYEPATNTLRQLGGGTDIWGTSDQFRFTHQTLTGDGSITARVDQLEDVDFNAKAGVMIRESNNANSKSVFLGLKPSGVVDSIVRSSTGGTAYNAPGVPANTGLGKWVRITRTGNSFAFAFSNDGVTWNTFNTQTITMNAPVQIGFATTAHRSRMAAWSTLSNLAVTGNLGTTAPTTNALAAPDNVVAAPLAGANTSLKVSWNDVAGETGFVVQRSVDGVNFEDASGTLAAGTLTYTDANLFGSMRYFYRVIATGTSSSRSVPSAITSAVNKPAASTNASSGYAQPWISGGTQAIYLNWADVQGDNGYMVERSADNGTTFVSLGNVAKNYNAFNDSNIKVNNVGLVAGQKYVYRITPLTSVGDGAVGTLLINAETKLPGASNLRVASRTTSSVTLNWTDFAIETGVRIERSINNVDFTEIGTVGANVTAFTDTTAAPGVEYYYRVTGYTAALTGDTSGVAFGTAASANLPAGWASADVGTVTGPGGAKFDNGVYTVVASGNDIYNAVDGMHFVYKPVTGDTEIITQVTGLENTNNAAKAGVVIRQDLTGGSKMTALTINAGGGPGIDFRTRLNTGTNSTYQQVKANVTAPYWLKMKRVGNAITTAYSADGQTWTAGPSTTLTTTGTYYVGLAVTAFSTTALNTTTFANTIVTGSTSTAPAAPVITFDSDTGTKGDGKTQHNNASGKALSFTVPGTVAGSTVELYIDGVLYGVAAGTDGSTVVTSGIGAGVSTATLSDGPHTVTARQIDAGNAASDFSASTSFVIDTVAARVAGVMVDGSGWTSAFRDHLAASGLGSNVMVGRSSLGGFTMPADGAARTLPWQNVDTIRVRFDGPVSVTTAQQALSMIGVTAGTFGPAAFRFDTVDGQAVASFVFGSALSTDKLRLKLLDTAVVDDAGNALDGEFDNAFVSGNGTAGGNFTYRANVLPGDVDGNGLVLSNDVLATRALQLVDSTSANYNPYADFDGNGIILSNDVLFARSRQLTGLPAGEPGTAGQAARSGSVARTSPRSGVSANGFSTPTSGTASGIWSILGVGGSADDSDDFVIPTGLL